MPQVLDFITNRLIGMIHAFRPMVFVKAIFMPKATYREPCARPMPRVYVKGFYKWAMAIGLSTWIYWGNRICRGFLQ